MNWLFKQLFRLSGWKFSGDFPNLRKYVVAVAPHTSNWDFVIAILARSYKGLIGTRFLGKKELFDGPFGFVFRALGGVGVDRKSPNGVVRDAVEAFGKYDRFILGIAPEGTRKNVTKLRTGFYQIALGAGVPIVPVGFDFPSKTVVIGNPLEPTGNMVSDLESLFSFYRKIKGKERDFSL